MKSITCKADPMAILFNTDLGANDRLVAMAIIARGYRTQRELAKELGISLRTTLSSIHKLQKAEVL